MAVQSAVACSEAKDGGLLVSWQLMECVPAWFVSFSLSVEDSFLSIMDTSFDFFCELICYFISPNASVCWYPLKNNAGRLSEKEKKSRYLRKILFVADVPMN